MNCKMNCQAFNSLLQQCENRNINIIENVCCLEVEVRNIEGCYFANVLKTTCLKKQDYLLQKPATYVFLVDKETFSKFFIGKLIEKLIEKLKEFQNIENEIIEKLKEFQNVENKINTLDEFFKKLEEILKDWNLEAVDNKQKEELEELKRCLNFRNYNYFPLYVGSTNNFSRRYKEFRCSLRCGEIYPNKFGGNLHQHLITLTNFSSMKMCLFVFYTNEDKKSNGNGYKKDKAQCIESFILKHPNFCKIFKIFNDEDGDCLGIQKIKRIAEDIEKEAKKINNKSQKIIPKPEEIIQKVEEIIQKAEEISNKVEEITKAEKAEDIKKKAENIEEILKTIKEKYEEIINAIQIANDIIKTIQKLESCP